MLYSQTVFLEDFCTISDRRQTDAAIHIDDDGDGPRRRPSLAHVWSSRSEGRNTKRGAAFSDGDGVLLPHRGLLTEVVRIKIWPQRGEREEEKGIVFTPFRKSLTRNEGLESM